jgi:hypothetical protein
VCESWVGTSGTPIPLVPTLGRRRSRAGLKIPPKVGTEVPTQEPLQQTGWDFRSRPCTLFPTAYPRNSSNFSLPLAYAAPPKDPYTTSFKLSHQKQQQDPFPYRPTKSSSSRLYSPRAQRDSFEEESFSEAVSEKATVLERYRCSLALGRETCLAVCI